MLLIGSTALKRWVNYRDPADLDIIGKYHDVVNYAKKRGRLELCIPAENAKKLIIRVNGQMIEAEIAWPGSLAEELIELVSHDPATRRDVDGVMIPSIHVLYMLKMSHRYLRNNPHFKKTMNDIHHLRKLCAEIPERYQDWYKRREAATYDYNHPKLNVSKGDFFNGDGVKYVYDHDSIHLAVKHLEKPAYTYFKPDENEVYCSKELFQQCSEEVKLYSVLEESYVLAIERSQVPFGSKAVTPYRSFQIALEKVCTSITSGWWREYAWEHYMQVEELYDDSYIDRFWDAVETGLVKPYNGKVY